MFRRFLCALTVLTASSVCPRAFAWDASELQFAPADGEMPGGGGIVGTGSKTDQRTECGHCHVDAAGEIDLTFTPDPPFGSDGDLLFYEPERRYDFTVTLTGEHLGIPSCVGDGPNGNLMAATFEDANGENVGTLQSDTGQNQATSCPTETPDPNSITSGSTLLAVDCRVILSRDANPDVTAWKFRWTAPAAGAGDVTLFGGGVDGDCGMTSLGDDVKMVKLTLSEGPTTAFAPPSARRTRLPSTPTGPAATELATLLAGLVGCSLFGSLLVSRRRRAA